MEQSITHPLQPVSLPQLVHDLTTEAAIIALAEDRSPSDVASDLITAYKTARPVIISGITKWTELTE